MFDGIDHLVLPAAEIDRLLGLYVDALGFTAIEVDDEPDPRLRDLWQLPAPPARSVLLGKPGSTGGWIRLVQVPGLPEPTPAGRPDRVGPYALDFYLRRAPEAELRTEAAGWTFRTEAVSYSLPGTDIPVRERMLEQPVSGLLHAFVQHRPRGTRCVIDGGIEDVSEVVAAVFLTERFEEAAQFAAKVLGGHQYFTGRFAGPEVEQMLGLDEGEGFRAALFRGPGSRNARLEFGEAISGGNVVPDPIPRVVASCGVSDLNRLKTQLRSGEHGQLTHTIEIGQIPHIGLVSKYGATFDFYQRTS
ncbi:MAG: hypothetical protein ABI206_08365 [Antricoccus sp.]